MWRKFNSWNSKSVGLLTFCCYFGTVINVGQPATNKFRGSTNQPAQLTHENMRYYLHLALILDLFMKNSTFTNKSKIVAFLKYFFCFVKMSTLIFFSENKQQHNFKTNHTTFWEKTQSFQTGQKESNIWSANFVNIVKVQDWCRVEIISHIFKC